MRAAQSRIAADRVWQDFTGYRASDRFTDDKAGFIASHDGSYLVTVSGTGWPDTRHRGRPSGFLKIVDDRTLAFADYRGNWRYISTGNLAACGRACLFLMDYPNRARLKICVHVESLALDAVPALTE